MSSMFDRLTDRARQAMLQARKEEARLGSGYIGPEHILLGILKEGNGLGNATLKGLLGDLSALLIEVEKLSAPPVARPRKASDDAQQVPFTCEAKLALEMAVEEAAGLKHGYIGTEHLLLGLLRDSEGVAARALKKQGLSLEQVRHEVVNRLPHSLGTE